MATQKPDDDQTRTRAPPADETAVRNREQVADGTAVRDQETSPDITRVRELPGEATRSRDSEFQVGDSSLRAPGLPFDDSFVNRSSDFTLARPEQTHSPVAPQFTMARPASPAFGQGFRLRGRYELDELIGQGAMGQVWRAKDLLGEEALDRNPYVAVKVLNSDFESRPDAFIALHREATRAQKLAHPNIVTVYVFDRDEQSGRAFIAMELLEGRPLDQLIRQSGAHGLPREQSLPIIRGMAEGLAYAHRKGIVHSDFKPANVFLTNDGTPKILDFGIARAVQVAERVGDLMVPAAALRAAHSEADDSGFQGYTVNYAAPEALNGAQPDTTEDVFSLGIVAYELVSGAHPFKRMSALDARAARIDRPPVRGLKRRECNAIERALAYEPAQRFRDAAAFLRQLQGVPVLQKTLIAAVGLLIIAAAGLWYRNYVNSLPNEPLEQLPIAVQRDFLADVRAGNDALEFIKRTHNVAMSQDAAESFAAAYRLHKKDPQAVRGLEAAADYAIDWFLKLPDRPAALNQLELFRAKSDYYQQYAPLQKAIRSLGGQ